MSDTLNLFYFCPITAKTDMPKYLAFICLLFCFIGFELQSQNPCIKGRVTDSETLKGVALATIRIANTSEGTVTDSLGRFELCGVTKDVDLEVSHAAYELQIIRVNKQATGKCEVMLTRRVIQTQEVEVVADAKNSLITPFTGKQVLKQKDILSLPTFLGESDVLKAVQLLPGVQSVSEGNSGVFVRGGGAGQNLFILDDMELMNPSHLMGIYSVFNPLVSEQIEIYKGHSPVHLLGRLSSTIAVQSRTPSIKNSGLEAHIGNISSNVVLSHVSSNEKVSFITGFRRSHIEALGWMASAFVPAEKNYFKNNQYAFYDFNGKLTIKISPQSSLTFSWYLGNDHFGINNAKAGYQAGTHWGNQAAALIYKRTNSNGDGWMHSLHYTGAYSGFSGNIMNSQIDFDSRYSQLQQKNQWSHQINNHLIYLGLDAAIIQTVPQDLWYEYINDLVSKFDQFQNVTLSAFLSDRVNLSKKIELYGGIRLTADAALGPYAYNADQTNGVLVPKNQLADIQYTWSPVIALSIFPSPRQSVKLAFSRNAQHVHLASISSIPLPNDLWMTSSPKIKPEISYQLSAGYYRQTKAFDWSAEIYSKVLQNQLIYNVNMSKDANVNFEDDFYHGKGIAYGLDCSISRKKGWLTGSVNYSLAHSQRSFPEIMNGKWFDDKYDRLHDLNIQASHRFNDKWDAGMIWVFATGNTTTLPSGRWWMMGGVMNDYTGYNNFRFPPYHRLDLSVNRTFTSKRFQESVLNISLINIYNRQNPYFLFYKVYMGENQYNIDIRATQISLFPILPSISWRVKF